MIANSLTFRLITTSVIWVTITLAAVAVLLTVFFETHVEEHYDSFLYDHLEENVAAARLDKQGQFYMTWVPADRRFNMSNSGFYWQVNKNDETILTSASLGNEVLVIPETIGPTETKIIKLLGPRQEKLRAIVSNRIIPGQEDIYSFVIAGSVGAIESDVKQFSTNLRITLLILGFGLLISIILQIKVGLQPLRLLRNALMKISSGEQKRLPESFPSEVQPVVHELNTMLDHSEGLLERARTQLGDLAHALKNPLTVIRNEARDIRGDRGRIISDKADVMRAYVDRYLSRARAAGTGNVIGAIVELRPIVKDISYLMAHMYNDRNIDIVLRDMSGLCFKGDAQDLEEMLGNLLDNACKWARRKVVVSASQKGNRLLIDIADDGPGIPEDKLDMVLKRGRRLDETVPGSGLGLGIVMDLVQLYHGSLTLAKSPDGGLTARLELPAAIKDE